MSTMESIAGIAMASALGAVVIVRSRTNAIKMATRCENPAEPVAIYSGNGIWSFPRAATWHFLSDSIIIYPLGFVGEQTSFVLSSDFVFDGAESFDCHGGHSAPLGEHFDWLELNETNPQVFCSYERDSAGLAAITRADPRVISKRLAQAEAQVSLPDAQKTFARERRNRKAGG
jgi:hypothetical protein